jgi:hypothetical protein
MYLEHGSRYFLLEMTMKNCMRTKTACLFKSMQEEPFLDTRQEEASPSDDSEKVIR